MTNFVTLLNYVPKRSFSLSRCLEGKRNFRKFVMPNKRGTQIFKKKQAVDPDPDIPIDNRGVKSIGYKLNGRYVIVPEKIPELIVPNLENCDLKPYVSYKAPEVVQSYFTAEQLFNAVYAEKVIDDFKSGKLDADGNPLNPSPQEKLTPEEALKNAKKSGSDIFLDKPYNIGSRS